MRPILSLYLVLLLVLTGCQARDQAAAEAIAGTDLLAEEAYARGYDLALQVRDGVRDFVLATRGAESLAALPPAQWTPDTIHADPRGYAAAGDEAREDAALSMWAWIFGGGGILALLLGIAKKTGIGGPAVTTALSVLSLLMESQPQRKRRKRQPILARAALDLVRSIPDHGASAAGLPLDEREALLDEMRDTRHTTAATAAEDPPHRRHG